MSNTQNMATVYYLGGIKNDLSNQWNSLLNIQNLASACLNADRKIQNDEFYAGGNILRETNNVTIDTAGSGYAVGDLIEATTNNDDAYYIVQEVDSDGGVERLLLVQGTEGDTITGVSGGSGEDLAISGDVAPNTDGITYDSTAPSGFISGDYIQLTGTRGGTGAIVTVDSVDTLGTVTGASVAETNDQGSNYEIGDYLYGSSDGSGRFAVFQVSTTDSANGGVTGVTVISGGIGYSAGEEITIRDTEGQAAIYSVHVHTIANVTHTILVQVYGGLDYSVSDTVTVQTNGDGDTSTLAITIDAVGDTNVNIGLASYFGNYWAGETSDQLRVVNGASTSSAYVTSLENGNSLDTAITNWEYGIKDCLQSLMLSMSDTIPDIYDRNGTQETITTPLSSASVAPYMFNAADDQTQVGIMMKNKALGDYGDFLQNQARAWNMLLANLTYGPTTMFNINSVNPFIVQLNALGNSINAFCNELDIVYVQIRSGTYSVANNAAGLQAAYATVLAAVDATGQSLNTLRQALIA